MGKVIVDTNIFIYLLKRDFLLGELLDQKKVYISYITELNYSAFQKLPRRKQHLFRIYYTIAALSLIQMI